MSDTTATIAEIVDAAVFQPDDGKEPCPDCGRMFVPGPGMGVHRHSAHGGKSKRSSKPKRVEGRGPGRPPRPSVADLTAEDIFDTVVGLLFPRGTVPINALTPLLRWRHATDEMLIEVRDGSKQGPSPS